jgi:hypothetical protein
MYTLLPAVMFRYRAAIIPRLPIRVKALFPRLNHYTQLSSFSDQLSAGLSSNAFDIEANIREGDSRSGLDEQGVQEVAEIMRRERVKLVTNIISITMVLMSGYTPVLTRRG